MDYKQDPLYKKFKEQENYKQDPLYKKFKEQEQNSHKRLEKIDEYIPDFAEDFVHGSAKNVADYTASIAKLFGNKKYQKKARLASNTLEKNIKNKWAGIAGEMLGDPLNLTPAGIVSKGTKTARVAKSMVGGAGVGATTMFAKDYGNDTLTIDEKITDAEIGAGFGAGINGLISALTKGKVKNVINNDAIQNKGDNDIADAILKNSEDLGLNKIEEDTNKKVLQYEYPKVPEKFKIEQAGYKKQNEPNFQIRPKYPPVKMDTDTALSVLAKEADKKRIKQGLEPIYSNKYERNTDFETRYNTLKSHPRFEELIKMREEISAKDVKSPQVTIQKGAGRELYGYNGENKHTYDRPIFDKNYAYDFQITKRDVQNIRNNKIDDDLLSKLETDLDTLDNHPDYQIPENNIDYNAKLRELDNTDIKLNDEDWKEANEVFAKGIDNLAVGTYAGIEEDENGNITFNPEKFILGLGGYTAVKTALKNGEIRGKLKDIVIDAIDRVNYNPEVQKRGNSFNSMTQSKNNVQKDLLIHHNLTQDNLKFADEKGGLAVPSLAITKKDNPLDGFGNITLLGDEKLAKPSREHKVFGADIYSPRYPKVEYKLKAKDKKNIVNELQPYREMLGKNSLVDTDNLTDDINLKLKFLDDKNEDLSKIIEYDMPSEDALKRYEELKGLYRDGIPNREYGQNPEFVSKVKDLLRNQLGNKINNWSDDDIRKTVQYYIREMKETAKKLQNSSKIDYYKTRSNISKTIANKYNDEYKKFVRNYYKSHGAEEKIYNGSDSIGRPKYIAHTLDNVVKKLKKDLRGGENFNYGTGSLRAKFAPQFKTLEQIRKAKDKLISNEEFEKIKNEIEDEYFNLKDKLQEYHNDKSFSFENTFNGLLEDSVRGNIEQNLKYYGFKDVPKKLIEGIESFKKALVEMPTEYFESKVLRVMDLGEFKHAVIPKDASNETRKILEKKGIEYTEYDPELPIDRINKIKTTAEKNGYLFANSMHSMAGGFAGGADSLINQRDYNNDGTYDYKDLLAGVASGAISINALKKLAPKLFEEEAGGIKAGLFAGENAKGFKNAKDKNKIFDGKYDNLQRFEIDDSVSKINEKNLKNGTHKLSDILEHEELYHNYPELKDTKLVLKDMPDGNSGYYDAKQKEIGINSNLSKDDIKSSLLHEIQHAIQKEEGFARGGSAQEFYNDAKRKIDLLKYELEFEPDDFIRDKKIKELDELQNNYVTMGKEEAYKKYQNLAGEIEARDVQSRANFNKKQREDIKPYSSENISPDDAEIKYNSKDIFANYNEDKKAFVEKIKKAKIKGYDHIRKIVSDESAKEWGDATNNLKRWFTDTLGAKYHDIRESATASTNGMSVKLERLHNALKELSEKDRTELHNYIAGDSKTIQKSLKPLADKFKKDIDDLSKELVSKGVLSQEQYDEWAGYYIHRNYEKHFFKDIKGLMKKGFKIDDIHKRGNIQEITSEQAKKLLTDVSFIASLKKPLRDGGNRLTKKPNGKYELRRDWTKQEREAMNEITDGAITIPETLMRLKRMADNANFLNEVSKLDEVMLKNVEKMTDDEIKANGFIKVPNSPKFGVLAGKHLRRDVYDDISARNDEIFNTFHGSDGAFARVWKNYLSLWKKSKTVWNAPSHLNNFMSNQFLMHLSGMRADEIVQAVGRAGKMMYQGNKYEKLLQKKLIGRATKKDLDDLAEMGEDLKYFIEAKDKGLLGRSQLNDILAGQKKLEKKGFFGKLDKFTEDLYHGEDAINKIAMYAHFRGKLGMSADEARKAVLTIIPDYSKPMPKGYRVLRDTGVSPFISWSYYTMPSIYKLIKTKQGAKKALLAIGTLSGLEYILTDGAVTPIDNLPFVKGNKPSDFKGRRFGVYKKGDKVTTIKTDRWIPYIELMNPINFAISNVSGVSTNAVFNLISSTSSAGMINPYYGRPITYKNKDAKQKAYDYAKYLTQSYVPLPAQLYTGWNTIESLIRSKKNRKRNDVVMPRTTTQELLKNIGLNSLTYSKSGLKKEINN